jgi:tellurite resistance protein
MPYWPGYSDISPQCRATYLDWLANGRNDASYDPGYMFMYFYGLERRFFVDQSNEDAADIVEEVRRLKSLYPDNHSVSRYLSEFIDLAMVVETDPSLINPIFERQGWELPFSLKFAIGTRIIKGENLSADWVLSWFICNPESNLRTPATRCRDEFFALFRIRFDERFPEGLKVNKPRKSLAASYRAASGEFEGTANPRVDGKPVPDISSLRKPIEIAQELADEVMNDLDKLSRFLGRNPDGRGSVEAHALLPSDLWQSFPSEEMEGLRAWASAIVNNGGLVPLADVIERLEGDTSAKIGKRQLTGAADALARLGFGLAPDPRFALRSPKPEEPVVLFTLGEPVEKLEEVSDGYRSALIELMLGTFVAHADGKISEAERKALEGQVESAEGLGDPEQRRLRANLEWFLTVPPDIYLLRRKLKEVSDDSQAAMRAALVTAALADGIIHSDEVASIEKIYKVLGLNPTLAYSDLHAGEISDGPRQVRAAQPGHPGETIPKADKTSGPRLDVSRIAAIRSDTERVSSVLGQIFDVDDDQDIETASMNQSLLPGLDPKHNALVLDLIIQEHWSEDGFEQLCEMHGLMPSGALETVNEWAFETHDEALLDEYEGYDVSQDIAETVRKKMVAEDNNVETETA